MANELVTQEQLDKLLGMGYTGHSIGASTVYPPVLNVLQSDKQYEAFEDKEDITVRMYGKLFVRKDSNTTKDLVDSIEGTIIKIEKGYEVRNEEDNSIVESGIDFATPTQKEMYAEQGLRVINMIKLLIAPQSSKETDEAMEKIKEMSNKGESVTKNDNPFFIVVVKGSSFGSWFKTEEAMHEIAQKSFNAPLYKVPSTSFKVTITSKQEENEKKQKYYSLEISVSPNEVSEALAFAKYTLEMKNQSMFYKVKEAIERANEAREQRETQKELAFKKIDEVEEETKDEIEDELPF